MVNISSRHVKEKIFQDILTQLSIFIAKAHTRKEAGALLYDLLSTKERILIAKRLAAIVLLHKGVSPLSIQESLKLSPATVAKYQYQIDQGTYKVILKALRKKEADESLLNIINKFFEAGLPPRGRGRLRKLFYE